MLGLKASIAHCPHRRRPPRLRNNLTLMQRLLCLGQMPRRPRCFAFFRMHRLRYLLCRLAHVLLMLLSLNCLLIPRYKPLLWLSRLRVSMVLILALSHSV